MGRCAQAITRQDETSMLSVATEAPIATDSDRRDDDVIAAVMLRRGRRFTMCAPPRADDPRVEAWLWQAVVTAIAPVALLTPVGLAALG
jgi:hypothetical protein